MVNAAHAVPAAVLREARRAVETNPLISAVVLFGSRARGDHHPESDCDLAVVSAAPCKTVHEACRALSDTSETVQIVPVRPDDLQAYRNTGNRVERGVIVDGRIMAGVWRRPAHRKEADEMDHDAFASGLESFAEFAHDTISTIARAKARGSEGTNHGALTAFRAGEHAAKAILALYAATPRSTHGVPQLARELRNVTGDTTGQHEREELAHRIDELNGKWKVLNEAGYATSLIESMGATEERLARAARLAERCVDLHARQRTAPSREPTDPPDAHIRAVERIGRILHGNAESLEENPHRAALSPETNAAIEALCATAAAATRALVTERS